MKLFRRFLWWVLQRTAPAKKSLRPTASPPKPRSIPLPPGTPRHTTVKIATEPRPKLAPPGRLPGSEPPQIRRS